MSDTWLDYAFYLAMVGAMCAGLLIGLATARLALWWLRRRRAGRIYNR
jgi:NhaP-type Na+/H+ and K+/H+ antiporter